MRTVVIKAIEIVQCIRSGMNDSALMQKFKISAKGLQKLFNELESAGILDGSELEERLTLSYGSVIVDIDHGRYVNQPEWYYMVHRPMEAGRGLDPDSDLFGPGYFTCQLKGGQGATVTAQATAEQILPARAIPMKLFLSVAPTLGRSSVKSMTRVVPAKCGAVFIATP